MVVGDLFGGGIVFHVFEGGETGLVAALYDQSEGYKWGGFVDNAFINTFATDTAIGTGSANTDKIVTALGANPSAAKLCQSLTLNGFSDWYLPSKDELQALYENRALFGPFSLNVAYWSSSEYLYAGDYYEKDALRFWNGVWTGAASENLYRVRAIRTASDTDPINPIKPAPPVLVISSNYDDYNVVPGGVTSDMEFSLDGSDYAMYTTETLNAAMLDGDHTLRIRYPEQGINPASDYIELAYTSAAAEPTPATPAPLKTDGSVDFRPHTMTWTTPAGESTEDPDTGYQIPGAPGEVKSVACRYYSGGGRSGLKEFKNQDNTTTKQVGRIRVDRLSALPQVGQVVTITNDEDGSAMFTGPIREIYKGQLSWRLEV